MVVDFLPKGEQANGSAFYGPVRIRRPASGLDVSEGEFKSIRESVVIEKELQEEA